MNPNSFFISLLLIIISTTLLFDAHGMRLLPKEFTQSASYNKEHVSINRRRRRIISTNDDRPIPISSTISGCRKEKLSVKSLPEHYPDILDIAGMDYTSARRKTPIHN